MQSQLAEIVFRQFSRQIADPNLRAALLCLYVPFLFGKAAQLLSRNMIDEIPNGIVSQYGCAIQKQSGSFQDISSNWETSSRH